MDRTAVQATILYTDLTKIIMKDEEDHQNEETPEYKPFSGMALNRVVAILFVLGLYLIIFLKILVLD